MRHPTTNDMVERKIEVHKDKTLREATLEAYKVMCVCISDVFTIIIIVLCRTWG